jgi:hypothetical protein
MNRTFPQNESTEAAEGTAAHWVAWEILAGRIPHEGSLTPNFQPVTGEMLDAGKLVAETTIEQGWERLVYRVEEKLAISHLHEDCFGTPDLWTVYESGNPADPSSTLLVINLIDYKYGHRFVDEYFNLQGINYLVGILQSLYINDWRRADLICCNFTIVQPRCFYRGEPVRTHRYTLADVLPHITKLQIAARRAYEPNPEAVTNSSCIDCPGRHACDALQLGAYEAAEFSTRNIPVELSPNAAALELLMLERKLDHLSARIDGLKEVTLRNIQGGVPVRYYHLEYGRGRQKWNKPDNEVITLGTLFGHDLRKIDVVTPKQAIAAGVTAAVVNAMSSAQRGEAKLVPDNPTDVARVFDTK